MTTNANISPAQTVTRSVLIVIVISLMFIAVWIVKDILMLTLTAIIFAVLLTTPIRFFVQRGLKRPLAVLITLALVLVLVVATALLLLPGLFEQFRQLVSIYIPGAAAQLQDQLKTENLTRTFPFLTGIDPKAITEITNQISTQVLGGLGNLGAQIFPFVGGLASTALSILIVFFLAMYFVADPATHEHGLLKLMPLRYRPRAKQIMRKLDRTLRKYLQAQIVLMLLIGVSTSVALLLIGVPLAGALGTITGLFAFIPNFGPLVALVPILAVAIINTPQQVGLVIVVFYVLQFVQSQLITPLLMGQEVNLPPAVILLSQIIAGIFFGFLGLLLSVPLAAILVVLVREIYVKDILGDFEPETEDVPLRGTPDSEPLRAT
ncbi:MAG: AI-2E family transporter [Chloroflexota bacterium]